MQDHFTTLDLPRRASLDADTVKARFQERSRDAHPDAGTSGDDDAFSRLNAAQSCLSRPSTRLRHLLELETGSAPDSRSAMSPELTEMFSTMADIISRADHYIARKDQTTTAVARAMLSKDAPEMIHSLMEAGGQLAAYRTQLEVQLAEIDTCEDREERLSRIGHLAHEFAFIEKWQAQIQERMGKML